MPAGRPPKPTRLKELTGNPGGRPLNRSEPAYTGDLVRPDWLTGYARQMWDELAPMLEDSGVASPADVPALAALCYAWDGFRCAVDVLAAEGQFTQGSMGQLVRHPAATAAEKSLEQFHKFAAKFGLTPSDRARLSVSPDAAPDAASPLRLLTGGA